MAYNLNSQINAVPKPADPEQKKPPTPGKSQQSDSNTVNSQCCCRRQVGNPALPPNPLLNLLRKNLWRSQTQLNALKITPQHREKGTGTARKVSQTRGQLGFFSRPRRQSSTGKIRAANSPGDLPRNWQKLANFIHKILRFRTGL